MKTISLYLCVLCFAVVIISCERSQAEDAPESKPIKKVVDWRKIFDETKWGGGSSKNLESQNTAKWLEDPFKNLQIDMKSAIHDLGKGETKPPAKTTQPRIVSRLDELIAILEKKCSGGGPGGANPSRPAESSTLAAGPGGQGEMRAPATKGRDWAKLTPSQRKKILQSKTEGFPPGYEDILADYFRRLAKNKSVKSSNKTSP